MNEIRDILLLSPCESSCVKFKRRQTDGGRGQNWGYILGKDWILTEKGNRGASREQFPALIWVVASWCKRMEYIYLG